MEYALALKNIKNKTNKIAAIPKVLFCISPPQIGIDRLHEESMRVNNE